MRGFGFPAVCVTSGSASGPAWLRRSVSWGEPFHLLHSPRLSWPLVLPALVAINHYDLGRVLKLSYFASFICLGLRDAVKMTRYREKKTRNVDVYIKYFISYIINNTKIILIVISTLPSLFLNINIFLKNYEFRLYRKVLEYSPHSPNLLGRKPLCFKYRILTDPQKSVSRAVFPQLSL